MSFLFEITSILCIPSLKPNFQYIAALCISLNYGLEDPAFHFRQGQEVTLFLKASRVSLGPTSFLFIKCCGSFQGGKADGAWIWPLKSTYCSG